jgi:hypothetical protein
LLKHLRDAGEDPVFALIGHVQGVGVVHAHDRPVVSNQKDTGEFE